MLRAQAGILAVLLALMIWAHGALAQEPLTVRLGLVGAGEEVFAYEVSVLKLALEHSGHPADLEINVVNMPQDRAFLELENGRAQFNVFVSGFSADRETRFRQIDVPLTRGLLGHRLFITTPSSLERLARVKTLEDLKSGFVVGSGTGWPDTDIFRAAGFQVETSLYENLWTMTAKERVHVFNRGIHEAFVEIGIRKKQYNNLVVDQSVMVRYPFDYMFYTRSEDEEIAALIERGLLNAYENGAFMTHFLSHPMIRTVLDQARPEERLTFDLENPLLTKRQRAVPSSFWHRF